MEEKSVLNSSFLFLWRTTSSRWDNFILGLGFFSGDLLLNIKKEDNPAFHFPFNSLQSSTAASSLPPLGEIAMRGKPLFYYSHRSMCFFCTTYAEQKSDK